MYSKAINEEINEDKKTGCFHPVSVLIGDGNRPRDVGFPVSSDIKEGVVPRSSN